MLLCAKAVEIGMREAGESERASPLEVINACGNWIIGSVQVKLK